MGNLETGYGHHRLEGEIDNFLTPVSHPRKLSLQEVKVRSVQEIPLFQDYNQFILSEFFRENNDLGTTNIQIQRESNSITVQKLHRILIILGYLRSSDFFVSNAELQGYDSDAHQENPNGGILMEGYFGHTTKKAVELFQENNGITSDGIVGNETKNALYRELFVSYHAPQNTLNFLERTSRVFQ